MPFHFVHLPLHFLKQQESRSQDHLCEFKWEQKGLSESWEYFCPPTHFHTWSTICQVPGLVADLGLVGKRCSSPSLWLNLGQHGRKLSLPETKESSWRGAQGSHGLLLHRLLLHHTHNQCWIRHWSGNFFAPVCAARALPNISRGLWKMLISYRGIEGAAG